MTKKINVRIKNSYGIIEFTHNFAFDDKSRFYGLYAQNGTMKSSFAKTLDSHSKGEGISDRLFGVPGECLVDGIDKENILSYPSFDGRVEICDEAASLVANEGAKRAYNDALKEVGFAYEKFTAKLVEMTKTGYAKDIDIVDEMYRSFVSEEMVDTVTISNVTTLLKSILPEIKSGNILFCNISYKIFTSSNFNKFIVNKKYSGLFRQLAEAYDRFRASPTYYRNGFDASSAHKLIKAIGDAKYFDAEHIVSLKNREGEIERPISSREELEDKLKTDLDRIIDEQPTLKAPLSDLIKDFSVGTNGEVRKIFEDTAKRDLLLFMGSEARFYKNMWYGYLRGCIDEIDTLLQVHEDASERITNALENASSADNEWEDIVNIFNDRFSDLPYKITIANKKDAIVNELIKPVFEIRYQNPRNPALPYAERPDEYNRLQTMGQTLSNGERKALFLLNIIFQLRNKLKSGQEVLIVFDDIVESFDYKNKYAFFEYLQDLSSENEQLFTIVLTHNFDFFRLVYDKIYPPNKDQFKIVTRQKDATLVVADMFNPRVFGDTKRIAGTDKAAWIAMIPFSRNLVEFRESTDHEDYKDLTKGLHIMTNVLTVLDAKQKIAAQANVDLSPFDDAKDVHAAIIETAQEIADGDNDDFDLHKNITLAIGTRLLMEKYIITQISDQEYRNALAKGKDQTRELIKRYKNNSADPKKTENVKYFNKAAMVVDSSIHLNSFMYEPLIDMGTWELKEMYNKIKSVTS